MGRAPQYEDLAHFLPHTAGPWPSKTPLPDNVKWSIFWKATQPASALKFLVSTGAFKVPSTMRLIGALQGPSKHIWPSPYVPAGTRTELGVGDAHASFQAASKA